jgi:hypothetical protein
LERVSRVARSLAKEFNRGAEDTDADEEEGSNRECVLLRIDVIYTFIFRFLTRRWISKRFAYSRMQVI